MNWGSGEEMGCPISEGKRWGLMVGKGAAGNTILYLQEAGAATYAGNCSKRKPQPLAAKPRAPEHGM